jgi:site-specific DNA-cytosine methylase
LGNAVVPQVAQVIGEQIKKCWEKQNEAENPKP